MNTNLSFSTPSQVETDCLVAVVLDHSEKDRSEKDKPAASVESSDAAVRDAAQDVIPSGEATGKMFETTLLHRPAGLKAKRLLLLFPFSRSSRKMYLLSLAGAKHEGPERSRNEGVYHEGYSCN